MFSWSFHSSNFGSDKTPLTADEEFIVDTGDDIIDAHSDVVSLFAFLLTNPNNPVSQHFLLSFMLDDEFGPWIPDQFASPFSSDDPSVFGYEAYITADSSHQAPASISFVGIQTDVSSVAVPEGFTGSFGVRLTEVPATTVIVETERVSGDPDISIVKGATLVFTPANWNIYQTVTIAAAEDPDAVNGAATIQCSVGGRAIQLVTVTEIDNDPIISRPTFSATVLNNGALRALISGDLNTVYALEASTDLTNWTSFATNTITASTSAAYPFSQSTAKVFVRARVE
jgi:hypothetical protein